MTINTRRLEELANALEMADKAKAEAEKARNEAEVAKKVRQKVGTDGNSNSTPIVPKPRVAEMAEGTDRLRRAMELMDDKAKYLAIQVSALLTLLVR